MTNLIILIGMFMFGAIGMYSISMVIFYKVYKKEIKKWGYRNESKN